MDYLNITIAFLLALLPALGWLFFFYHKDFKDPEPKQVVIETFVAGMIIAIPFLLLRSFLNVFSEVSILISGTTAVLIFAAMEELAKLVAAIYVVNRNKKEFNQVIDGIVYAVTAALGFAFVENKVYFYEFLTASGDGIFSVFAFRSLGTMLAHTIFSGIAGLVWAYAYFSKKISPFCKKHLLAFEAKDFINKEIMSLHIIRKNILMAHPSRRGGHEKKILVLEGIFLATILHVIYNLMTTFEVMGQNLTFLLVPALMLGLLTISYQFTKRLNTKILRVV